MKEVLVGIIMALFIYGLFVENEYNYEEPPNKDPEEPKDDLIIKDNGEWIKK